MTDGLKGVENDVWVGVNKEEGVFCGVAAPAKD